jgi:V/A-type H+-transporting ATPase subunit I
LNFEQITIPFEYEDQVFFETPAKAHELMQVELDLCVKEIRAKHNETLYTFGMNISDITSAYNTLKRLQSLYELRKYAARTSSDHYIFVGWATESEAERIKWDIENDEKIMLMNEEAKGAQSSIPPTSLKNNSIVSPFEFFVRAYGLPKYGEIDPTPFVAGTYLVLFGMMFGDLGQGAVLSLVGYLLHKFKGLELGKILGAVGVSSMFFGLMYGSVFGIEHLLPTVWMKPAENVNSILFITLGCGIALILVAMALNIANAVRAKDRVRLFFGPNGVAGVVFYIGIIAIIVDFVYGGGRLGAVLAVPFVIIPLAIIAFRNQIGSYLETKRLNIESGVGLFILETVIETFEILLTYFTNTVSFVRVGAFALSHAGMMSVVLLLAGGEGNLSIPVMIVGNVLVIGMEGLVVGIQALRIEFYELFSRYYEGGGREFVPTHGSGIKSDIKYVA